MKDTLECLREERLASGSDRRYNIKCGHKTDKLFLSIADGDFAFSKHIEKAVSEVVSSRNLAYAFMEEKNSVAISKYYKKHYDLKINNSEILYGNGVLYWIQIAIHALTQEGDKVLIMPPVYEPFNQIIEAAHRDISLAPLVFKNNKFKIDFKLLEKQMAESDLLILCSPHNPTGNVWTHAELEKIAMLAKKHNVYIVADEIWQDIIMSKKFSPMLNQKKYLDVIIHVSSPVKTFNLGGLQFGVAIIKNEKLLDKMRREANNVIHYSSSQPWVSAAVQNVYSHAKTYEWVNLYKKQIKKNFNILTKWFNNKNIVYSNPESTYLLFVKLGNKKYQGLKLEKFLQKYGLHVGMGYKYGPEYNEWIRIDVAICDNSMKLLIKKLETILKDIKK